MLQGNVVHANIYQDLYHVTAGVHACKKEVTIEWYHISFLIQQPLVSPSFLGSLCMDYEEHYATVNAFFILHWCTPQYIFNMKNEK